MATYRPPRRYLRHYRRSAPGVQAAAAIGAAVLLAGVGHAVTARAGTHPHHHGSPARSAAAATAIRYARAQLGKPYCWGGTGASCPNPPYTGYDCSGLIYEAYASAGIAIPRTTFTEWPALPHVPASQRRAGDLVFAPGSDGSMASPGHVGLLIGRNTVIQAYGTGYPIDTSSLSNFAAGAGGIVGYARPGGAS